MKSSLRRTENPVLYHEALNQIRHRCKCGHTVIIPKFVDKQICDWCGKYVFRTKQAEFNYRIKEKLNKKSC